MDDLLWLNAFPCAASYMTISPGPNSSREMWLTCWDFSTSGNMNDDMIRPIECNPLERYRGVGIISWGWYDRYIWSKILAYGGSHKRTKCQLIQYRLKDGR